ncbi:MAG: enoyl-CoA hydratase [Candidatus Azotimanducaceae bacterium]
MYEFIKVEREGFVTRVVFNRPKSLNALNVGLMLEIEAVSNAFLNDEKTRVVIFSGEGKHFSAGADLKQARDKDETMLMRRRNSGLGARMIRAIQEVNQVTIAAIQGAALGGGACITTACDFRVATDTSFCGYPEVNLGINLMWQSLPLCVRLIGPARAKRMIMLGENEKASTLLEWGYVDEVVPESALYGAVDALAQKYARQPPIAVQMIKQSINTVSGALDNAVMHMDTDQNILSALTQDQREGMKAFFEKREPDFKGD